MITLNLDVKSLGLGVDDLVSPKVVGAIESSIQTSLALIKDRWQHSVQDKLNSTRPEYLKGLEFGIQYPYGDHFCGAVVLDGKFPNMLEKGFKPFDIKIGFSKSQKIVRKKDGGWYLTIPLRHSTPNSFMYGQPMPKDVYGVAKKLNPYQSGLGNQRLQWKGQAEKSWTGYQHKTNIYQGMVRIVKSYQKATQSQYMTFRRVSDKSDPSSWWHKGFAGVHIADQIMPFARKTFMDVMKYNLSNIK